MPQGRDTPTCETILAPSTKMILIVGVLAVCGLAVSRLNQKSREREAIEKSQAEKSRLEVQTSIEQEARDKAATALKQAAAKKLENAAHKLELGRKDAEELHQRFVRMCQEIAGTSITRIEITQKSIEHIVAEDKVYFSGFRTPSYSQAEHESRQRQVFEEFPFEDGARRYKIVKKTKIEKQSVPELKIDVRIPVDGLELTSVLFVVSRNPQPLSSLNFWRKISCSRRTRSSPAHVFAKRSP